MMALNKLEYKNIQPNPFFAFNNRLLIIFIWNLNLAVISLDKLTDCKEGFSYKKNDKTNVGNEESQVNKAGRYKANIAPTPPRIPESASEYLP